MPVMNGKECLQQIKKYERLSKIPVVMFSSSKASLIVSKTATVAATYYLQKPSSYNDFLNSIKLILTKDHQNMVIR